MNNLLHEDGSFHFYSLVNREPVKIDEGRIAIGSKVFQKSYTSTTLFEFQKSI